MEYSLGELLDRKGILELKLERGHPAGHQKNNIEKELATIRTALAPFTPKDIVNYYGSLIQDINAKIWTLEADIRQGKENTLNTDEVAKLGQTKILMLAEVGRRALLIRELNTKRIEYKNKANDQYTSGFKEYKLQHASQK